MFTETLPHDLTIYILSFLSFADIAVLHVLSHQFHQFLQDHEASLYHQLALSHRYAKKGRLLEEVKSVERKGGNGCLGNVKGWKEFCREACTLTVNWASHGSAIVGEYTSLTDVASKKVLLDFIVDEEHGLLLTRVAKGDGTMLLVARTLDGEKVVWALSEVCRFVHSGGYLLIWRGRHHLGPVEVWRYIPSPSTSDKTNADSTTRGTFHLYATLPIPPGGWRMYAFHAPCIALTNPLQGHLVHIFRLPLPAVGVDDTPTPIQLEVTQLIDLSTLLITHSVSPDPTERQMLVFSVLLDLQISDKYLCACFDTGLLITRLNSFSGEEGNQNETESAHDAGKGKAKRAEIGQTVTMRRDTVLFESTGHPEEERRRMPAAKRILPHPEPEAHKLTLSASSTVLSRGVRYRIMPGNKVLDEYLVVERTKKEIEEEERENSTALVRSSHRWNPNFISAQFSPNGKHLIAGTTFRCVYLFTDIDRMFDSAGVSPRDIVQRLSTEEPVRYLKWDGHDRVVALRDDENQTWLFDLCPTYHSHPNSAAPDENTDDPQLRLVGARALHLNIFGTPRQTVHGVQIRKTGVWTISNLREVLDGESSVVDGLSVTDMRKLSFVGFASDLRGVL